MDVTWNKKKTLVCNLPMTEFLDPKAHIQAHSGGTVKLAKAHCDST